MLDTSSGRGVLGRQFIDIREWSDVVLYILGEGWKRALECREVHEDVHVDTGEVEITERLRGGMRRVLTKEGAAWCKKVTVPGGTETLSNPDLPMPDGRTDIPVFFQDIREKYDEHDPHVIIECKRVAGAETKLCRLYVTQGIDRFTTGRYGSNHAVGFMAGYLLSGDAESAAAGINRHLTRKGRQSERLGRCTVSGWPWARSSRHPRAAPAGPIALHHAFFGLPPAPP